MEPREYARKVTPRGLVQVFLKGLMLRRPGGRSIVARDHETLGTDNIGTLSMVLRNGAMWRFVEALVQWMAPPCDLQPMQLVALDSMAVTLPKTVRHGCKKVNKHTVGGGVLWAYVVEALRGTNPIQILKVIEGAWSDSKLMRSIALMRRGPIYLMDRGFYAFDLIRQWMADEVRFIVRACGKDLRYTVVKTCGRPRCVLHGLTIEKDAIVLLGSPDNPKIQPRSRGRLVVARRASGEDLIVVSNLFHWSAEALLEAYRKRWHIERFHRFVKEALGLAHLYSFQQNGLFFPIHVAALLALLLLLAACEHDPETIRTLQSALRSLRKAIGLDNPWRRNTVVRVRQKKTSAKAAQNP